MHGIDAGEGGIGNGADLKSRRLKRLSFQKRVSIVSAVESIDGPNLFSFDLGKVRPTQIREGVVENHRSVRVDHRRRKVGVIALRIGVPIPVVDG